MKNLGVWFDNELSLSKHVTRVTSSCYYFIYNIHRIRKYLSRNACETIINALVTSRLDYCNSFLYGYPSKLLARLQRVQNSTARLVYLSTRFSPSSLFYDLHWLPVNYRCIYKILLITFKAIHSLAPSYIPDLVKVKQQTHQQSHHVLRSATATSLEHLSSHRRR